jgi:hypothetical protein
VAEEDADERALRCAVGLSSGRDLVEEFVAYGVWPLAHGWALGEVCPRQMPSRGGMLVRSPAFALDLRGRDSAAVVREAEDGAVRIVGRYVPKTEGQRSWDIRGSNDRLNRVFELNRLPGGDAPRPWRLLSSRRTFCGVAVFSVSSKGRFPSCAQLWIG